MHGLQAAAPTGLKDLGLRGLWNSSSNGDLQSSGLTSSKDSGLRSFLSRWLWALGP